MPTKTEQVQFELAAKAIGLPGAWSIGHNVFHIAEHLRGTSDEAVKARAKTVVHGPKVRKDGRHPAVRFGDDVVLEVRRLALRSPPADVQAQLQAAGHDVPRHSIDAWIGYTTRAHLVPDRARTTTYLKD